MKSDGLTIIERQDWRMLIKQTLAERTAEIKAEINRRADNDIAIAKQALRTKLEDYKEFQKTEEQLLEESFNRKKFNAAHDLELSKFEQKQAVELLEQQKQQELGY